MAGLWRDLCSGALFAAVADRPHQRAEFARRVALEVAGYGHQASQARRRPELRQRVDAADGWRGALHLHLAVTGRRDRRGHRRDQMGLDPKIYDNGLSLPANLGWL